MMQFLWLARLRERWLGKVVERACKRNRYVSRQRLYHRLELERLEYRIVPSITLLNSFPGLKLDDSGGVPPDTQGAAGPKSYEETVNAVVSFYDKTTGATIASDDMNDFFFTKGGLPHVAASDFLGDAFGTYDSLAGRFIIGNIDVEFGSSGFGPGNAIVLAVSKSNDPKTLTTADWNFYEINTTEPGVEVQDYPGNIGYNDGAVVITFNYFGTGPSHVMVNTISANALASGTPLTLGTNLFQTDFDGWSLRPAVMQDSTSTNDPMWFVEEGGDDQSINVVKMTNVLSSTPTYNTTNLAVTPYSPAVLELNPDGNPINFNTDSRIMNASMQNGLIVAAHQVSDAAGDLDQVQWYEINTNGGAPTLQQQGDVSGGVGTFYAYPGIAINSAGSIGMSFVASGLGTGQFMSTYVTGRNPSDPAGTMETPILAMAGTVNDDGDGREGDMSGINVDSDGSFWIDNEIAVNNPIFGADSWGTAVAHFKLSTSVSTQAGDTSAIYSPNSQSLGLSATVTDINTPSNIVNKGTVTFTIKKGSTVIGTAQGNVTNGTANANFNLPAGLAAGNYTIAVSYSDNSGNFIDAGDTSGKLTISQAQVTAAADNFFGYYSPNKQTLALSATLTDTSIPGDKINEGVVTFTVKDSSGITIGTAQGTVSGGSATANFKMPAGQPTGIYTISVAYSDVGLGNVVDTGDTDGSLTLAPANVITTASNVQTAYSPDAQTVNLTATVADASIPSDTVSEGIVRFTVTSGGKTLGTLQSSVIGGLASGNFNLAAAQAPGNYTVTVSYSDSTSNFQDNGDVSGTLAILPANVATTANNLSIFYSPNGQSLTLGAAVADTSFSTDTVGEGTVTFTLKDSGGNIVKDTNGNSSVAGSVVGGLASATFSLAAGQPVGNYTIAVSYSDALGNFSDNGDTNASLTISSANVVTTAAAANLIFSTAAQTVPLSATIADNSIPGDTVNTGIVTFTIKSGNTTIGNVSANVSGGTASTNFNWSAGRAAGNYTITVGYKDSAGNFLDSGDNSATLSVSPALVTTTAGTPASIVSSSLAQNVTLNATVADTSFPGDTVNEGKVTFTLKDSNGNTVKDTNGNSSVSGSVVGGKASAVFSVAGGQAVGNYTVAVSYSDALGNFSDNGDTSATLTIKPANVATTANSASAIYSPNGQTLNLSASVANTSVPVNIVGEGIVTFTVKDSGGNTVGTAQGNVSGGTANAQFNLPAGQVPGSYTIAVSYSDSLGNFIDNGDTGATLTISPAKVTTKASNVSTFYSPNTQTLALSAAVTDISISTDTVGEGTVTFTVKSGSTVLGSVQGNVTNGTANANFNLPAGQALGSYTITVGYTDSSGNFIDNGDTAATLTISPANVTTTASNVSAVYSPNGQTLTLDATVTDASISTDTVGEGAVTFTIKSGSTVLGSVQGNVTNGTASANFNLPGGQAAGSYSISVTYNDNTGHFLDSGDTAATLTISPANVTTTANNVSAAFSPNLQTLALTAAVTDTSISTDTVSQGSVTFTVKSGSTTIGSATGLVSGGKANASLNWPAGQAIGSYSITVSYSDSNGNFTDSGDTGATLTVSPAHVTTKANNVSAVYNLNAQTLLLSASLTDASVPSDIVTKGVVTFTVQSGGTSLGSVQGTVTGGTASANFTLPAGLNAGNYTIAVSYSESSGNFVDGGDTSGTLAITPASATVTANSTSSTFNTGAQTLVLSANVADPGPVVPNVVNEGVVTFSIMSGSTVIGSAQGAVIGGKANATIALPPGLGAGAYTIAVHYSDSRGNFADTGDTNATLAIGAAGTTVQLLQASFSPNYTNLTVTETITAHVGSSSPVNRGAVTFQLSTGQAISANVDGNGNVSVSLSLPMLDLLNPQSINLAYADAGHNLTGSTDSQTAAWQLSSPLLPSYASFTANGSTVTMDIFGLFITFTNGVLTEIDFGSDHLVFSYSTSGQLDQVTFDGINLVP